MRSKQDKKNKIAKLQNYKTIVIYSYPSSLYRVDIMPFLSAVRALVQVTILFSRSSFGFSSFDCDAPPEYSSKERSTSCCTACTNQNSRVTQTEASKHRTRTKRRTHRKHISYIHAHSHLMTYTVCLLAFRTFLFFIFEGRSLDARRTRRPGYRVARTMLVVGARQ